MKRWTAWTAATLAAAALFGGPMAMRGPAMAQAKACDPSKAPQMVSGQIVKVDMQAGRVTVRATDGVTHEFQATKETLADLKPGDKIDARLRSC